MLNAHKVKATTTPGTYTDGPGKYGLALSVMTGRSGPRKYWVQRCTVAGKRTNISLGKVEFFSLSEARDMAFENARALARREALPHGARKIAVVARRGVPTFRQAANAYIEDNRGAVWSDSRTGTIRAALAHAKRLDAMLIGDVSTHDVIATLRPIWATKNPTAKTLRATISKIMRIAIVDGHRSDDPADSRIDPKLPTLTHEAKTVKRRAALPFASMPDVLRKVAAIEAPRNRVAVLAFRFLALTGVRPGEVIEARWSEIDTDTAVWTIPAGRMKAKREHRVPLSDAALAVLDGMRQVNNGTGHIFAKRTGAKLGHSAFRDLLPKAGISNTELNPHGTRTMLRGYLDAEHTDTDWRVRELTIAHERRSDTERAYSRSDMLDQRRPLMTAWADFAA